MYEVPNWSDVASKSVGLLYRSLQNVEIYVEDKDSEAIYTKLLGRVLGSDIKIRKIIPLEGRAKVVERCKDYSEDFPAIFIIDGDLELLLGERETGLERLFQHRLYCLENYLFCKEASSELLQDSSGRLSQEQASELLEWEVLLNEVKKPLLDLFKVYAVTKKLKPEEPTISRGYHTLCNRVSKRRGHAICVEKVNASIEELRKLVKEHAGEEKYNEVYEIVEKSVSSLADPLYAVSGKDYLLKALRDYLAFKGASIPLNDGFKFRLARYCDLTPLEELREAIFLTVKEGSYLQQH